MVSLAELWLPIVAASVFVFVVSSLVHMVFRWHQPDYRKLPNEDEVRAAIRKGAPAPGQYVVPQCADMKQMQTPEMQQKFTEGPNLLMWLRPNGMAAMGKMLGQWFVLALVVSFFVAYVASRVLGPGARPGDVMQLVATVVFLAYATGSVLDGIWMGKPWGSVAKYALDALLYGLASGAAFAWLWPGPAA